MVLGGTGLHPRGGEGAREIGYWIRADQVNKGYATEVAAALTRVGFEIEKLRRMGIHCDVDNVRSAAVPPKLGYTHEATLRRRLKSSDDRFHDEMVWTMLAEEYRRQRRSARRSTRPSTRPGDESSPEGGQLGTDPFCAQPDGLYAHRQPAHVRSTLISLHATTAACLFCGSRTPTDVATSRMRSR